MLYTAIDGTGVPMIPAATEGRPGKGPDGRARTREVKLACLVRDPDSSSYLATFAPAAAFAELDAGDIEAIIAAARKLPLVGVKATERDKTLTYFETNAHRMRYARFRELGMFVGSGAVEAGCKAVIGQRLKLSGMRWSLPGATGILTLRCQQASDRWEEIWTRNNNQTEPAELASPAI